jgi:hypothetical protein
MKELPKEAPDEVRKVAQTLIARYKKARKDASSYIYFARHDPEQVSEEWAIADNFERNETLVFKVATSKWWCRDLYTGTDMALSGLEGALKAARTWKLN